jgi:hypothetical protein
MAKRINYKKIDRKEEDISEEIRTFPLYVILICVAIVIIAGLYLLITSTCARSFPVLSRYGGGTHYPSSLNGVSVIIIGLLMCVFPVYQIIKQAKK